MTLAAAAVAFFSVMAFWKPNPVLYMLAGGSAFMTGFYWFDTYTNNLGLSIGLCLIAYSFYCLGMGFRMIFWRGDNRGDNE